jgi:hypothetical protein
VSRIEESGKRLLRKPKRSTEASSAPGISTAHDGRLQFITPTLRELKCEHKLKRCEDSLMMEVRKCRNMRQIMYLPRSYFSARSVGLRYGNSDRVKTRRKVAGSIPDGVIGIFH